MSAKLVYKDTPVVGDEMRDCPLALEKEPDFARAALRIATILQGKNSQYGNSFNETHKIMEILYPDGVAPEQYKDMLAVVRILDKLFRISRGDQGEESAWDDIAGYALLKVTK